MEYLLEYVTLDTVLMRHPNTEAAIRKFFADAGTNIVRACYNDETGLGGYIFYVKSDGASSPDDVGRYYKLVTSCDATWEVSAEGAKIVKPREIDRNRIERQFSHNEWFTGPFRGRLDWVAAVEIVDLDE